MTENEARQKFLAAVKDDPFNTVSAHGLPDGGVELMLSHRITLDGAWCVRIPPGDNIAFLHDPEQAARLARTNEGGSWGER